MSREQGIGAELLRRDTLDEAASREPTHPAPLWGPKLLVCPACGARYRLPAALAAGPKRVRCSGCGHSWREPTPPAALSHPTARRHAEPEGRMPAWMSPPPEGYDVFAPQPLFARPRRRWGLLMLALAMLVAAAGAAAVLFM